MGRIIDGALALGTVFGVQYVGRELGPIEDKSTRRWYDSLNKPDFTPPGPVFAAVWTVLDGLLAWSGYRLLRAERSAARSFALILWALCVAGVAGFPIAVFRERDLNAGLVVCIALVAGSGASIAAASGVDRKAAQAQVPFFAWLIFALFLHEEIWRKNP